MFRNLTVKIYLKYLEMHGFNHGVNFNLEKGANIDRAFCNMICCGDNVTLTKNVYILAHDASMKKFLGKTKIGHVNIGNNVFVGAHSVILPGVTIGDNVIIATNSSVSKDIPQGEVWGGVPAHFIMTTEDFLNKHKQMMITDSNLNEHFSYID